MTVGSVWSAHVALEAVDEDGRHLRALGLDAGFLLDQRGEDHHLFGRLDDLVDRRIAARPDARDFVLHLAGHRLDERDAAVAGEEVVTRRASVPSAGTGADRR